MADEQAGSNRICLISTRNGTCGVCPIFTTATALFRPQRPKCFRPPGTCVHFLGCSGLPALSAWPRCAHSLCSSGVIYVGVSPAGTELHLIVSSNPGADVLQTYPGILRNKHQATCMEVALVIVVGFRPAPNACASVSPLPGQAPPSPPRGVETHCFSG
jgi:hypothetical protein